TDTNGNALTADVVWTFRSATGGGAPVAAYAFSEGSGTTTADATGNGNVGTLGNGPTWTTGYFGNGISFDGVNDQIQIPMSATLASISSAFTFEAWIKPSDMNQRMIVSRTDNDLIFLVNGSSQVVLQALLGGSWKTIISPPGSVPVGAWSHV